ncbi:MAG: hypothetical protein ACOC95_04090 [Planctomycetota bacterium]
MTRAAFLVAGIVCAAVAAAMPWLETHDGTLTLAGRTIPPAAAVLPLAALAVGTARLAWVCGRALKDAGRRALVPAIILATTVATLTGAWFGLVLPGVFRAYEFRPVARLVAFTLAAVLIGGALDGGSIARTASRLRWRLRGPRAGRGVIAAATVVGLGSAAIGWGVFDAMPHIADGCAYILQGKMLAAGERAIASPVFEPLMAKDLYFIRTPYGWAPRGLWGYPALLAAAGTVRAMWLVNPLLAALVVWLTWRLARDAVGSATAALAAGVLALCPWLWFNATTFMPHLASTAGLLVFAIAFRRVLDNRSPAAALAAGGAIGAVVMIRFQDAAFFALPAVVWGVALLLRRPRRWLGPLAAVLLGAAPGVAGMMAINASVTGGTTTSYAGEAARGGFVDGVVAVLAASAPASAGRYLAWLHENIAQFSGQWLAGALPIVPLVGVGLWQGRRALRRLGPLMVCSLSLLGLYGTFVFGGRSWVGPRWYVPLLPATAILIAVGLIAAVRRARGACPASRPARAYLATVTAAVMLAWMVAMPAQLLWWRRYPPHGVDRRVVRAVERAGLTGAVIALPPEGMEADGVTPNYKWLRTAAWSMSVPLDETPVLYVSAVDGWEAIVKTTYPQRRRYRVSPMPGCFDLIATDVGDD